MVVDVRDAVHAGVEEFAVVGDDHQAAGVARQILFQPQDGFEVEVVGRLVEQQQIGAVHQRARQVQAHAPAAGKALHRAIQRIVGEPQAVQQLRRARRCGIAVDGLEAVLRLEPCGIVIPLRQHFFEPPQLGIAVEHEFQRG